MIGFRYLPPAEEEMTEAARFYENEAAGLGADFLDDVQRTTRTYLKIPRGRDGGVCGAGQGARNVIGSFPMSDERHGDVPQTPRPLRVAHQSPALCVNRLGDSSGYHLRLAP